MEKISLYDKDNNKVYGLMLSPEDAHRTTTDIIFATTLLNATIKDKTIIDQNEEVSEDLNICNTQSDLMSEAYDINSDIQSTLSTNNSDIQSTDNSEETSIQKREDLNFALT
ncbi:PREDICTED: uncharacterized protein LOC108777232 [Cyphomyrmex costatus]|uniref:uncharacterized protein LOC108777232 n=1 Tax=Cyphomyrmex costatus TaxID=456900 RepID=UPI0008523A4B|nr:PREDICTED: uncharacterized protein LOC108777232 [Cyphomyrmex costatus]